MPDMRLDDISFGDDEIDTLFRRWREAIERNSKWTVAGNCQFESGPDGFALYIGNRPFAKIAKTGPDGIDAMTGTTPGVGEIVFWSLASPLVEGEPDIAYNIAPQPVAADTWIVVNYVDGEWLVIYEICPATP